MRMPKLEISAVAKHFLSWLSATLAVLGGMSFLYPFDLGKVVAGVTLVGLALFLIIESYWEEKKEIGRFVLNIDDLVLFFIAGTAIAMAVVINFYKLPVKLHGLVAFLYFLLASGIIYESYR